MFLKKLIFLWNVLEGTLFLIEIQLMIFSKNCDTLMQTPHGLFYFFTLRCHYGTISCSVQVRICRENNANQDLKLRLAPFWNSEVLASLNWKLHGSISLLFFLNRLIIQIWRQTWMMKFSFIMSSSKINVSNEIIELE